MSKPQVLVLIDWYKPYFKAGGPVRSLVNLVDHLGDRVGFHVLTSDRDYMAAANEAHVPVDRWVRSDAGEMVRYASPEAHNLSTWRTLLHERRWDVIYINGLYSTWSTIVPLWLLRGSQQRRIVAVRGMLAAGPMRQGGIKKRLFLRGMKALGCFRGVEFQATNEEEEADIRHWIGRDVKLHLVQNLARKSTVRSPTPIVKESGQLKLASLARIAEEKNTLFAIERLARIKGQVRLDLYGTIYDQAYFERCKAAIAKLPPGMEVIWHGQLPNEQAVQALAGTHALYMPSVGENFGHTMLEALSAGRPLVISDRTPWKGLEAVNAGWDLPLEDPERFTQVIQALVDMGQGDFDVWVRGAYALGTRYLTETRSRGEELDHVPSMSSARKAVDLSRFDNSTTFHPGAGFVKRTLWYFVNALFFQNPLFPFRSPKPGLLRLFGARVGRGVVIHPGVNIKFPWKLSIGDHSWIGQRVWLDNLDQLTIGNNVVISQGAMIIQGSHDYKKVDYPTYSGPVVLEDGSWVGAGAIVTLGVTVHSHAVLAVGSVATKDLEPYTIHQGNPARPVRERVVE